MKRCVIVILLFGLSGCVSGTGLPKFMPTGLPELHEPSLEAAAE